MSATDERTDTVTALMVLARIEERLARIEAKLEVAEQAIGGFITGPGVARLFRAIKGG